ncbi:ABC transporter permease [Dorea sp. OM07-5]|uniref:ABC transporter permease subunit n=1 Tax=Dorea sp. OM07-5 TaxID=2293100 RepID=UPI000E557FBA|nr:ABC transporter permease [Dorea sp. OM07-5]RHU97590.1 ABC transporter permease [Dorea sp. OM07-5]
MKKFKLQKNVLLIFLLVMIAVSCYMGIPIRPLLTDMLIRLPMNGVFVLSLLPMLNAGMGFNFGMPVGIIAGLISISTVMNFEITGVKGFLCVLLLTILISFVFGRIYGRILIKASGTEEITGNFLGLSIIPLSCILWVTIPFDNPVMVFPIAGKGMRPKIGLEGYFDKIIEKIFQIKIGGIMIPVGYLLCFFIVCVIIYIIFKSNIGQNMLALGENEAYCEIMGLQSNKIKMTAIVLSTIIAGVGICFYSQSYGYLELYNAPKAIAFSAASALLIGGCTEHNGNILNVIVGTLIFHGILVFSVPLANELVATELTEITRSILTNVIILFAMFKETKKEKNVEKA